MDLPIDAVYIQIQPKTFGETTLGDQKTEFLIKASFSSVQNTAINIYHLPAGGQLDYSVIGPHTYNITWAKLTHQKGTNKNIPIY